MRTIKNGQDIILIGIYGAAARSAAEKIAKEKSRNNWVNVIIPWNGDFKKITASPGRKLEGWTDKIGGQWWSKSMTIKKRYNSIIR